jgi:hypothetical protein
MVVYYYSIYMLSDREMDEIWHYNERWFKIYNYSLEDFQELGNNTFKIRPNCKLNKYSTKDDCLYLQTYGGGPEGGYIISDNYDVFSVERFNTSTFKFDPLGNNVLDIKTDGRTLYCKMYES